MIASSSNRNLKLLVLCSEADVESAILPDIIHHVNRYLSNERRNWGVRVEVCPMSYENDAQLETTATDVAPDIVVLFLSEGTLKDGLRRALMWLVKSKLPVMGVHVGKGESVYGGLLKDFLVLGGDECLHIKMNDSYDNLRIIPEEWVECMDNCLVAHNRTLRPRLDTNFRCDSSTWNDAEHLKLCADLQELGLAAAGALVFDLASENQVGRIPYAFTPEFIAKGYSGAVVFKANVELMNPSEPGRSSPGISLFVKASRDARKLTREMISSIAAGDYDRDEGYVKYLGSLPLKRVSDWVAIAADFRSETVPLQTWLLGPGAKARLGSSDVGKMIEAIFGCLNKAEWRNQQSFEAHTYDKLFDEMVPTRKKAAIYAALDELKETAAELDLIAPGDGFDVFRGLFLDGRVGNTPLCSISRETLKCNCHGDLHAKNVLIESSGKPRLIDPAGRRNLFWASDIARLAVDLWMNAFARREALNLCGDVKDRANKWHKAIVEWADGTELTARDWSDDDKLVVAALSSIMCQPEPCIRDRRGDTAWNSFDFQFALLLEFLLHCSYPLIPALKRCVALSVASELVSSLDKQWVKMHNAAKGAVK